MTRARRIAAEAVGTAFLLAAVVGSGIMGERLAGGNVAIALLANTLATGAMLVTLILTFGPISGAHFNPAVTLADAASSVRRPRTGQRQMCRYCSTQPKKRPAGQWRGDGSNLLKYMRIASLSKEVNGTGRQDCRGYQQPKA